MRDEDEAGVRFTDVLTTASTAANYLGHPSVRAWHVGRAIAILCGDVAITDLGPEPSPLVRRASQMRLGVDPDVRDLAQRWYAELGSDVYAELDDDRIAELRQQVAALEAHSGRSAGSGV